MLHRVRIGYFYGKINKNVKAKDSVTKNYVKVDFKDDHLVLHFYT